MLILVDRMTTFSPPGGRRWAHGGREDGFADEGTGGLLYGMEPFLPSPSSASSAYSTSAGPSAPPALFPTPPQFSASLGPFVAGQSPLPLPVHLGLGSSLGIGLLLLLLILCCVIGNLFVISAILIERDLRSRPQYYLIFSLAIADLMVGLIVTPLGAWTTLRQAWELGVQLCDFWISMDVLVCTSSILHLVAIALDRYWSVTDIYYTNNRTPKRIFSMLLIVWVLSLLISLAPQFVPLLKDEHFVTRIEQEHICLISQDVAYQVFSTSTAFYIPLCAIIIIYYKIMRAAKKRFRRERDRRTINRTALEDVPPKATKLLISQNSPTAVPPPTTSSAGRPSQPNCVASSLLNPSAGQQQNGHFKAARFNLKATMENAQSSNANLSTEEEEFPMTAIEPQPQCCTGETAETEFVDCGSALNGARKSKGRSVSQQLLAFPRPLRRPKKKRGVKESLENQRERKAYRTLAIITGTFIACWTPFFVLSLYRPICIKLTGKDQCENIPVVMEQIFNWLGYLNSALNPIIYTIFSTDFRLAFERILRRILCCRLFPPPR